MVSTSSSFPFTSYSFCYKSSFFAVHSWSSVRFLSSRYIYGGQRQALSSFMPHLQKGVQTHKQPYDSCRLAAIPP